MRIWHSMDALLISFGNYSLFAFNIHPMVATSTNDRCSLNFKMDERWCQNELIKTMKNRICSSDKNVKVLFTNNHHHHLMGIHLLCSFFFSPYRTSASGLHWNLHRVNVEKYKSEDWWMYRRRFGWIEKIT